MATTIRPRTDADVDACVATLRILYETENYPLGANRDLKDFLTNEKNQQCWVAEDEHGQIVGHVSTSTVAHDVGIDLWYSLHQTAEERNTALLSRLFVLREHRSSGVAAKLVEAAVKFNAEQNIRLLLTVSKGSQAAIRLYRRLAWTEYGETMILLPDGEKEAAIAFVGPRPDI